MYSCYLPHHTSSHSQFSSKEVCFGSLAEPIFPTTSLTNSNESIFLVNYVAPLLLLQLTGEDEKICVVYGTNVMWELLNP